MDSLDFIIDQLGPGIIVDVYFHKDFDGIGTMLYVKKRVESTGATIRFREIQYGEVYNQVIPSGDWGLLLDFVDGFDRIDWHTDHHENTYSTQGQVELFPGAKSNAGVLLRGIGETEFAAATDCIDSAGYATAGYTAKEQRNFLGRENMAAWFALNKTLMAFKGKKIGTQTFLETFVDKCDTFDPLDMLNLTYRLAMQTRNRWGKPFVKAESEDQFFEILQKHGDEYSKKYSESKKPVLIETKNGIVQTINHPAAYMGKSGAYDRYVPFEVYPETNYLVNNWWPIIGLVQASHNPSITSDANMIKVTGDAIARARAFCGEETVDMRYFKKMIKVESDVDLIPPRKDLLESLLGDDAIHIVGKQIKDMDNNMLKQYKFNAWDLIMSGHGGHKAIANIPHISTFKTHGGILSNSLVHFIVDGIKSK